MDSLKEVSVNAEEVDVLDYSFSLNTAMGGVSEFVTDSLNGELVAVLIDVVKPVCVKIVLDDMPGVVLFEDVNVMGQLYLPLRTECISNDFQKFNYQADRWFLNNRLRVSVRGDFNTEINFKLRFC